ncbi:sodium/proton antiporter NhaB [Teredinibacter turnerae]|uniref:Na(+)/H(+) antiporter NhaB n=1 Tax=Teredinibacter turnerae (strain ATCC 39867 / T7901) TaxID=377629 RepID=NHAB_TERTT|nr:sodium/proton antiporter NhaB [Teredinibacter turnerae]C5BJA8.1 RecName: Full=Na(+)/H(+) antiporter NhaB; AltName: Full=Sodium/proton antiporter NhaB [Teredinibacter turnerae T7901]ACR12192.1 Na+/H+ antiporter NhaB [Teredinibacter turnerae T7901]
MSSNLPAAFANNFLGQSSTWYKTTILAFLVINPVVYAIDPFIAGWVLILEFIFTLAMALKCYPLQPGGLLAIEAVILGMTSPESVFHETEANFEVILLLIFMVAGIYFMKDLLLYVFTKILLGIRSKIVLSLLFSLVAAVLSAFLDALTVTAVLIAVAVGFYAVYHQFASGGGLSSNQYDHTDDSKVDSSNREDLEGFRSFLRSLIMHGAVGTALGGVCTLVGEPQNLLIAQQADWNFVEFFLQVAPVSMPTLIGGLVTCIAVEKLGIFGYGAQLPDKVRTILMDFDKQETSKRTNRDIAALVVQALAGVVLMVSLALHLAEVGLIGLLVIILLTSFNGITEEHRIGHAFEEALPFTALLVVFFAVVAVIHDQHLFEPITHMLLHMDESVQGPMFFIANGLLSMISDNVFVATVYITEVKNALVAGDISREHFDLLAVAINTGTNLPSVATPNGQAAFLFLLTSALAPLIRLSYGRMVLMALPYTIVLSVIGYIAVYQLAAG